MTPDSGAPLSRQAVSFLRRLRDDPDWAMPGYRCISKAGLQKHRRYTYPIRPMRELVNRGMLIRDPGWEKLIADRDDPIELYTMTFKAGLVLTAWDEFETK